MAICRILRSLSDGDQAVGTPVAADALLIGAGAGMGVESGVRGDWGATNTFRITRLRDIPRVVSGMYLW